MTDCGGGVDDDAAGRVFDAFFSTKAGGLGMGLSICRSIIEVHGGRLWATGNSGQPGATFRFSLPASREGMPEIALAGLEHNREDSM